MPTFFGTGIDHGKDGFSTAQEAAKAAKNALKGKSVDLALVFSSSDFDYGKVVAGVRAVTGNAPLLGCSTAGEFTQEKVLNKSIAVGFFSSDEMRFFLSLATGLKADPLEAVKRASKELPYKVEGFPHRSAILLHDGLAGKGEETVLSAASVLGSETKLVGGSAGDDLKFQSTSVFVNDRVETDAVAFCLMASKKPIITSVKHGHAPIGPELKVTKAVDNILYEVDGRTAWDVWREHTRAHAREIGIDVNALTSPSEVGSFLVRFELGLNTGSEQYKVRVPLSKNDNGSLNFACSVAEGSVFRIMRSPKADQIQSARDAAKLAKDQVGNKKLAAALVFDCCCRGIILGAQFRDGVDAIKNVLGQVPLLGFETYGEICMDPGQFSGFHNTTTVLALIQE